MTDTTASVPQRPLPSWPHAMLRRRPAPPKGPATRFADWLDRLHMIRILAALSNVGILIALIAFWFDFTDRYDARTNQAWQLLTSRAPGNSGKIEALEYLNKEIVILGLTLKKKQDLVGLNLSSGPRMQPVYLAGVQLPGALLPDANLSRANLESANLSGAYLAHAEMIGTRLYGADLRWAQMRNADLTGAHLFGTDLRSSWLSGVRLTLAKLHGVNLGRASLALREFAHNDVSRNNISGAQIGWPGFPKPLRVSPGKHPVTFWAFADDLPAAGGVKGGDFGDVDWEFVPTAFSVEELKELIPGFTICDPARRQAWRRLGSRGMPSDCDPAIRKEFPDG